MDTQTPLHFVTLRGSLRRGSYNAAVARALPALAPEGVTISALGSVGELPHYDADLHADGFPSAVVAMGKAIKEADGVIIVTPEYNYSVPGALKNALDWLSRLPTTPFAGKPVAIQTGSPGLIGGARCQYHLRQILVFPRRLRPEQAGGHGEPDRGEAGLQQRRTIGQGDARIHHNPVANLRRVRAPPMRIGRQRKLGCWLSCASRMGQIGERDDDASLPERRRLLLPGRALRCIDRYSSLRPSGEDTSLTTPAKLIRDRSSHLASGNMAELKPLEPRSWLSLRPTRWLEKEQS